MENFLSPYLVGRLDLILPLGKKLLHTRQNPSTRSFPPSFKCPKPYSTCRFPAMSLALFPAYTQNIFHISYPTEVDLLAAFRSRVHQKISFNSDYFILCIFNFLSMGIFTYFYNYSFWLSTIYIYFL